MNNKQDLRNVLDAIEFYIHERLRSLQNLNAEEKIKRESLMKSAAELTKIVHAPDEEAPPTEAPPTE